MNEITENEQFHTKLEQKFLQVKLQLSSEWFQIFIGQLNNNLWHKTLSWKFWFLYYEILCKHEHQNFQLSAAISMWTSVKQNNSEFMVKLVKIIMSKRISTEYEVTKEG